MRYESNFIITNNNLFLLPSPLAFVALQTWLSVSHDRCKRDVGQGGSCRPGPGFPRLKSYMSSSESPPWLTVWPCGACGETKWRIADIVLWRSLGWDRFIRIHPAEICDGRPIHGLLLLAQLLLDQHLFVLQLSKIRRISWHYWL